MSEQLLHGDCFETLATMPEHSVHAVVTDPPYGLNPLPPDPVELLRHWLAGDDAPSKGKGFMSKSWDSCVPGPMTWREVHRVLKPGGFLLCFAGTRTVDLMGLSLRLAGFEVQDCLSWLYGTGFPKAHDAAAQIDRFLGAQRTELLGHKNSGLDQTTDGTGVFIKSDGQAKWTNSRDETGLIPVYAPASEEAKAWDGWHTALKPAFEPILLARKPREGTIGSNLVTHGTGALNIDGCRIEGIKDVPASPRRTEHDGFLGQSMANQNGDSSGWDPNVGRWPSNVLMDEDAAALFGESRFFYVSKPSRSEKDAGLEQMPLVASDTLNIGASTGRDPANSKNAFGGQQVRIARGLPATQPRRNIHTTVKPIDLMRYLVRLVTPAGGTTLDPFLGSGTTGIAALLEGVNFIGIEREAEYLRIAEQRLDFWREHGEHGLEIVREREAAAARREALEAAGQLSLLG